MGVGQRATVAVLIASLASPACGSASDQSSRESTQAVTSASEVIDESEQPVSPTVTEAPAPSVTAVPTSDTETARALPTPSGPVFGLDAAEPPAQLDADGVAIRAAILVLLDTDLPFGRKRIYLERADALVEQHEQFMALLRALQGQLLLTEPEIEIAGDRATASFSAVGPTIGQIDYTVELSRIDNVWTMTYTSACEAISLSSVGC